MKKLPNLIEFKILGDERGRLIAIEGGKDIPFDIKRVFYIYGTQGKHISRGNHSHYKTKQFLVAVNGSCKVTLDNGISKETYDLNKSNLGLLQDTMIWGSMHDFSHDCVLLVLSDRYYEEEDYITDYQVFLKGVKK